MCVVWCFHMSFLPPACMHVPAALHPLLLLPEAELRQEQVAEWTN